MTPAQLQNPTAKTIRSETATRAGIRVTLVGSAVNLLLVVFKLWAGYLSKSQALIADGIHSLSDLFSDLVVYLGLKWSGKQEDSDHPYGHARFETISSMIVGLFLILVGGGIAYNAISSIYDHEPSVPGSFAIYVALASVVFKELLYWFTLAVGKRLRSLALIGNAWHHRSDALSSVAVLIGVGATYINPSWHLADTFAALIVIYFVARVGANLVWTAFKELTDTAPDQEVLDAMHTTSAAVEGVREVHDMRARLSGSQIFVELHVVVDPNLSVRDGHAISRAVKHRILDEFADVTRVITHIDPDPKPG